MNWNQLKEEVYYVDGSWRDIYVLSATADDWRRWVELINANYVVEFWNGPAGKRQSQIRYEVIERQWMNPDLALSSARFRLAGRNVNCRFFAAEEIENDIDPAYFQSPEAHEALLAYLGAVSGALHKPVLLTPEDEPAQPLLAVNGSAISFGRGC
jgi:hypothetical protein